MFPISNKGIEIRIGNRIVKLTLQVSLTIDFESTQDSNK